MFCWVSTFKRPNQGTMRDGKEPIILLKGFHDSNLDEL